MAKKKTKQKRLVCEVIDDIIYPAMTIIENERMGIQHSLNLIEQQEDIIRNGMEEVRELVQHMEFVLGVRKGKITDFKQGIEGLKGLLDE